MHSRDSLSKRTYIRFYKGHKTPPTLVSAESGSYIREVDPTDPQIANDVNGISDETRLKHRLVDTKIPFDLIDNLDFPEKIPLIMAIQDIDMAFYNSLVTSMTTYLHWKKLFDEVQDLMARLTMVDEDITLFQLMSDGMLRNSVMSKLWRKKLLTAAEQKLLGLALLAPACVEAVSKINKLKYQAEHNPTYSFILARMKKWEQGKK